MTSMRVMAPMEGLTSFPVSSASVIAFDFALSSVTFERRGADLVLFLENGHEVILENFFVADESGKLPTLRLEDGAEIAGSDFLVGIMPDFDISTAMDPPSESPQSGSSYSDDAGNLLGDVDITLQLFGDDTSLTVFSDIDTLAPDFFSDDSPGNDLLPVRHDGLEALDGLKSLFDDGNVNALEDLILDIRDTNLDELLTGDVLDCLYGSVRDDNADADVVARTDSLNAQALEDSGWIASVQSAMIEDNECMAFSKDASETLYIQLMTSVE